MRELQSNEFESSEGDSYTTWTDGGDMESALSQMSDNVSEYGEIAIGSSRDRTFLGYDGNLSVRSEYNRADYDFFRPNERVWRDPQKLMAQCNLAYKKVSIVRSVVDMMSDFSVQGIRIVHPNKNIENFYRRWAEIVNHVAISERIINTLYRVANCPIKLRYGKVNAGVESEWRKSKAEKSEGITKDVKLEKRKIERRMIPLDYKILNPTSIEIIGGEVSTFFGKPIYALKLNHVFRHKLAKLIRTGKNIQNEDIKNMLKFIPDNLKSSIINGQNVIPLDQSKIEMLHYKKDDWEVWATPILASILDALGMLEKMHLSDLSALDGAISNIRLWRLGDLEHKIIPTRAALNKLRNILHQTNTGPLDLVWGPELDFKESNTQVHHFLGPEKYQQVMSEIYSGLGVPPSLTGAGGSAGGGNQGFTNNFISMKVLVERLELGRKILIRFWNDQFRIIQKAMGFRFPAKLHFDNKVLADEAAEKRLIVDMWDRNIVSNESVLELCKRDPDLEVLRVNREQSKMESGNMAVKTGPFHQSDVNRLHELKKLIISSGGVAPSQIGVELEDMKDGEKPLAELAHVEDTTSKPIVNNGRPKGSSDKKPRQRKEIKPARKLSTSNDFVNLFIWGNEAQSKLSKIVSEPILEHFDKTNLRKLNKAEQEEYEYIKYRAFSNLEPYSEINRETVYNLLDKRVNAEILAMSKTLAQVFKNKHDKDPSVEQMREIQSSAFAFQYMDEEDE